MIILKVLKKGVSLGFLSYRDRIKNTRVKPSILRWQREGEMIKLDIKKRGFIMTNFLDELNLSDEQKQTLKEVRAFSIHEANKIMSYSMNVIEGNVSDFNDLNEELNMEEESFLSFNILPMYFSLRINVFLKIGDFENAAFYLRSLLNVINKINSQVPINPEFKHLISHIEKDYYHLKRELSLHLEYEEKGRVNKLCQYFLVNEKMFKEFDIRFYMKRLGISRGTALKYAKAHKR